MSNDNEEQDFALYPDAQNMYSPLTFPFSGLQNFETEQSDPYSFPRQESYPVSTGLNSTTMYAEAQPFMESPDMRAQAPSNYSTASGASAASSAMGSPHSIHGHIVPIPEWAPHGLGLNPSIVGFDSVGQSNEYSFNTPGMEDFALDFNAAKAGFVGECDTVTTSASHQQGLFSSNPESLSSLSTCVPSPRSAGMVDQIQSPATSMSMASPITPDNPSSWDYRDTVFKSAFVSAFSVSPTSTRRPSQALSADTFVFSSVAGPSPVSAVSPSSFTAESIPPFPTSYHSSSFFSQSSRNFVPSLESSCRFFSVNPAL